ncbi:MAG: calcium-binding protein, partial [Halodesulfovibrio sp.]|uniref:calcium-binding protein n=1 Tax=Halodesulfovibrio sp. TaxID=1912772 RepID=UPI00359E991E
TINLVDVISTNTYTDGDDTIIVSADTNIAIVNAGSGNDTVTAGDTVNIINGGSGDDTITTGSAGDTISGGSDNDTINAGDGNNIIIGGSGNDIINVGDGNDIITGGTDNDIITGGAGGDTYIFNIGDGNDTIIEGTCDGSCTDIDVINLGVGISVGDITYNIDGDDLIIGITGHDGDSICITGGATDPSHGIEQIVFADGTTINLVDVISTNTYTDGDDTIIVSADT